ncbi:hypothetical protein GCM10028895_33840 [Pontibacter rugosus]
MLNTVFMVVLAGVVLLRYRSVLGLQDFLLVDESPLLLHEEQVVTVPVKNSTVLVLGNDISYYAHNKPVTPYLNWKLAQRHFGRLSEYRAIFLLHENIAHEQPAYIIDKVGLMPELAYKLPDVFGKYEQTKDPNIYKLN